MKTKVVILSLVAAVFIVMIIAFKGCNDAVDNGVFEEQGAAVVSAEQAPENGEDAVEASGLRASGTEEDWPYPKIRKVEVWGARGLWTTFDVGILVNEEVKIRKTDGWLWHTTEVDLGSLPEGTKFRVLVQDDVYPWGDPETSMGSCLFEYSPTGRVFYWEVAGGFWTDLWCVNMTIK